MNRTKHSGLTKCYNCNGAGHKPGEYFVNCKACNGWGVLLPKENNVKPTKTRKPKSRKTR